MNPDNLLPLKDDMIAFIEGHGMRHFPALIPEDMPRVWWDDPDPAPGATQQSSKESWKDFVEMAKAAGAPMVLIGEDLLDTVTLELLTAEVQEMTVPEALVREIEKLDRLALHVGKLGHIELAFAHQGVLFVHETATEWYRDYREMVDLVDDMQELIEKSYGDMDEESD